MSVRRTMRSMFDVSVENLAKAMMPAMKGKLERDLESKWKLFGVESTNTCNARCSFCAYRLDIDKRPKRIVSPEVLKRSLELFDKAGGGTLSFFSFLGDPLTDPALLDKVRLMRKTKSVKDITIYTNLIGLGDFDVAELVQSGLTVLSVSTCLGGDEMYKRLYGVDKYAELSRNIVRLLEVNHAKGRPLDITIHLRMDYPMESNFDRPLLDAVRRFLPPERLVVLASNAWDNYHGEIKLSDLPKGAAFMPSKTEKAIPCYGLYRKLQVLSNGDISVCSSRISDELVVDNIFNINSLDEYWSGGKLKAFRQRWKDGAVPEICVSCNHYYPYTALLKGMARDKILATARKIVRRSRG